MSFLKTAAPIVTIAIACGLTLTSCKKEKGTADKPAGQPAPAAAQGQAHELLAREVVTLNNTFLDNLANVMDEASASAAAAKVEGFASQYEAIAKRMEKLGLPQGDTKTLIEGLFKEQRESQRDKVTAVMGVIGGEGPVADILAPVLRGFEARMDKLNVITAWGGGGDAPSE